MQTLKIEMIYDVAVLKKVAKSIGFDGKAVDQALLSDAAGKPVEEAI